MVVEDVHGYESKPRRAWRRQPAAVPSVNVSASTGVPDDHAYWQRPDPDQATLPAPGGPPPERLVPYAGPPSSAPPRSDWRTPVLREPPAPRSLPPQNLAAVDEAEGAAKTVTYGVGMVAAAIVVILIVVLCGRAIF